jgi:riboflavin kinase
MKYRSRIYEVLKEIKKASNDRGFTKISSSRLAERLGLSQQSGSMYINSLLKEGYIERQLKSDGQYIYLTEKGLDVLYSELNDLLEILDGEQSLQIRGRVKSGLGEGRYYISREKYVAQFKEKLDFVPYFGTLNIVVDTEYRNHYSRLQAAGGIKINGFEADGRTFGPVKAFRATIFKTECAVIMPERTVHTDVIEVISTEYLREKYDLKDGDPVTISVSLKY